MGRMTSSKVLSPESLWTALVWIGCGGRRVRPVREPQRDLSERWNDVLNTVGRRMNRPPAPRKRVASGIGERHHQGVLCPVSCQQQDERTQHRRDTCGLLMVGLALNMQKVGEILTFDLVVVAGV